LKGACKGICPINSYRVGSLQTDARKHPIKQILQNLKSGKTEIVEVPCPETKSGHLLIKTTDSLISAGTERMLIHRLPRYHLPELPQLNTQRAPVQRGRRGRQKAQGN